MAWRWCVDANNVIGARPDGWWRDRPRALHRLLDEVTRWREVVGEPVVVVADGKPTHLVPEGELYGVEVVYAHSRTPDAADDTIVRLLATRRETDTSPITVVTSDARLRERATELGATVEGARTFLERIAGIEPRRHDREVLAQFGIDESALLGRGGEARVFALDGERVLRLPHPGADRALLDERCRLLEAIARESPGVEVELPEVLERHEVLGRQVIVERRLRGHNAIDVLAHRRTDREALIRHHLDVARSIAKLPCPGSGFGELIMMSERLSAATFQQWATQRITRSLRAGGEPFTSLDPASLTGELLAALPHSDTATPCLVHLDAYLGNMLAEGSRITALLDFGPMTIAGIRDLDPLVTIAYLAPEITPTASDSDRTAALAWAHEAGLAEAVGAAQRWIAAYWAGAPDDIRLRRWCERILFGGTTS